MWNCGKPGDDPDSRRDSRESGVARWTSSKWSARLQSKLVMISILSSPAAEDVAQVALQWTRLDPARRGGGTPGPGR
jgi:hypothetical protein